MTENTPKTILLVEDEPITTNIVMQKLRRFGYNAISVDSGEKAVALIAEQTPIDLILMDIMFRGGIDGTEATRQILALRNIPIVFLTSHSEQDVVEKVRGLTRYGYVLKTSNHHILQSSIEMAFDLFDAHETIRVSEERHKAMIKGISEVIAIVDCEGTVKFVSPNVERLFGWNPRELLGTTVWERVHHEDIGRMYQEFESLLSTEKMVHSGKCRYKLKQGGHSWIDVSATNLLCDPHVAGVLVNFRDINEHMRLEQCNHESESKYKSLFDNSSDAILLMNREGIFVDNNRTALGMFRCVQEEISGCTPIDFSPEYQADGIRSSVKALSLIDRAFAGHPQSFEWTHRRVNGEEFIATVNLSSITLNKETFLHAILSDITEQKNSEEKQKQLQEQLVRSQRLESIGTLAAGIAHDFNNILAAIIGNASLLAEAPGKSEKNQRRIETILLASERGANVVKQLLTFARKGEIKYQPINVNNVVLEVAKLLEALFPKSIEVRNQLSSNLPMIKGDSNQLHQVLLNLSVNAKDAMPDGGVLSITTSVVSIDSLLSRFPTARFKHYVALTVKDSGVGMTTAMRNRIFDPFFTTKGQGKGTGLGLSIAIGIVEGHGGFIDVRSQAGIGTEFEIYFPAIELSTQLTEPVEKLPAADLSGTETILLIEDDVHLGDVIYATLCDHGYTVIDAMNGEEGVGQFFEHRGEIDLILSDIGMPKADGEAVYHRIRQVDANIPFLMMTGFLEPEKKDQLLSAGVSEILLKPFKLADLCQMIRKHLPLPSTEIIISGGGK